jgi:single-strand DNA-binding protein
MASELPPYVEQFQPPWREVVNVCIIQGRLTRPPEQRVVGSGRPLVTYEVSVDRPEGGTESVPVVWEAAPAVAVDLDVDVEVVVVGRVRRRWFRSGGATQSRTEVVAEGVVPRRATKRVAKLVGDALTAADDALPAHGGPASRASRVTPARRSAKMGP